jgi:hypothetical protein
MNETKYGKQPLCRACGEALPVIGNHQCSPTYKELEAVMKQARKCNNCMTREISSLTNEPLSCNGNENGTCDQDGRDNERIVELEAELAKHQGECVYDPDDKGTMDTGCGHCSLVPNNSQRFCTWCGKPIRLAWEKSPMGTFPSDIEEGN